MRKIYSYFLLFFLLFLLPVYPAIAGEKTIVFDNAIRWTYKGRFSAGGGSAIPTVWSPWFPLGVQAGFRYKLGFRCSPLRINLKSGIKVHLAWDKDHPRGGDRVKLRVSVEPVKETPTLDVAFGFYFPNKIQVGVIGLPFITDSVYIPGVGYVGWMDINYDLWDVLNTALSFVPGASDFADPIVTLMQGLGINANTSSLLPMAGQSISCSDEREVSFSILDILEKAGGDKEEMVKQVKKKMLQTVKKRLGKKYKVLVSAVKLLGRMDTRKASKVVDGILSKGIETFISFGNISIKGVPKFKVVGGPVTVYIKYWTTHGGSGYYPVTLTSPVEEKVITIPISDLVKDTDKLYIAVDRVDYEFKLYMYAKYYAGIAGISKKFYDEKKLLWNKPISTSLNAGSAIVAIPLRKAEGVLTQLHASAGAGAVRIFWHSPSLDTRGCVTVKKGSATVARKCEILYGKRHSVIITGLSPSTSYTAVVTPVDRNGKIYESQDVSFVTRSTPARRTPGFKEYKGKKLYDIGVEKTNHSITISWKTNVPASTEVYYGESDELAEVYSFKIVRGDSGLRKLSRYHKVTIEGLDAETRYYFLVRSITYKNNNPAGQDDVCLEEMGSVVTDPLILPLHIVDRSRGGVPIPGLKVVLEDLLTHARVSSFTDGTGLVRFHVHRDRDYKITIKSPAFGNFSYVYSVPHNAGMVSSAHDLSIHTEEIELERLPSGGYVFDKYSGLPLRNVRVSVNAGGHIYRTQTDAHGHFDFTNLPEGVYYFKFEKDHYVTKVVRGRVYKYSFLQISNATLEIAPAKVQVKVVSGSSPVKGAAVYLRLPDAGAVKTVRTNASGAAVFRVPFLSPDEREKIAIYVDNFVPEKAIGGMKRLTVSPGENYTVEFSLKKDTSPPVCTKPAVWSEGKLKVVRFTIKDIQKFRYRIVLQRKTGFGYESVSFPGSGWSDWILSGNQTFKFSTEKYLPGHYRLKICAEDFFGNKKCSDWTDFSVSTDFTVGIPSNKPDNTVVVWSKLPDSLKSCFSRYKVLLYKREHLLFSKEIEEPGVCKVSFIHLLPSTKYRVKVLVLDRSGGVLLEGMKTFVTSPVHPKLSIVSVQKDKGILKLKFKLVLEGVGRSYSSFSGIKGNFIIDVDGKTFARDMSIAGYEKMFSYEFPVGGSLVKNVSVTLKSPVLGSVSVKQAGGVRPVCTFEIEKFVSQAYVKKPCTLSLLVDAGEISLRNLTKLSVKVNWGDGTNTEKTLYAGETFKEKPISRHPVRWKVKLEHVYFKKGNYRVVPELIIEYERRRYEQRLPLNPVLRVFSVPPSASLKFVENRNGRVKVSIFASGGSFAVSRWTLNFGDGSPVLKGRATVKKAILHRYKKSGRYRISFVVRDESGNIVRKEKVIVVKVRQSFPLADVALQRVVVPGNAEVNRRYSVRVIVKNPSSNHLTGVKLVVRAGAGKWHKILSLNPGERKVITMFWRPKSTGTKQVLVNLYYAGDKNPVNNREVKRVVVYSLPKIDVGVKNIAFSQMFLKKPGYVGILLQNRSTRAVRCNVKLFINGKVVRQWKFMFTPVQGNKLLSFRYVPQKRGRVVFKAVVVCPGDMLESNNRLIRESVVR
ncbi:carboxypeptidase regulatory-like domain-containing protein [Desulfurobacterium sp.]